jgi:acyl-CoA hydrolase
MERIQPGWSIFIGTGTAEPRTLVKHLLASDVGNLVDLELIQIVSLGEAVSLRAIHDQKFRLKTFFSGWDTTEAISAGRIDLIPARFARIPRLFESGEIHVDAAFVQVSTPDVAGYCSLGGAVDVARVAMERAKLRVGEVNRRVPRTFGDTFAHISDFDFLIESDEEPIYFNRWKVDAVFDKIAARIEPLVDDRSCIAFSIGPLFEALGRHLTSKQDRGIHSPFFSDALMDLVTSGVVTNRYKELFRGKSLTSYAIGTPSLMNWLNQNPVVEFQGIDKVFNPVNIGRNRKFTAIISASKVDLSGRIVLNVGQGKIAAGPAEVIDFIGGAENSEGGRIIFGLPSRDRKGKSNIRLLVDRFHNQMGLKEIVDTVVTEYGVADLFGRTVRERAQALIDIAHPDDRSELVALAREKGILFRDQIYLAASAKLYPQDINITHRFKKDIEVRFRPIRPSDEEEMRRLFYRFSDEAVYYRYFSCVKAMPHAKMQSYVNVDWSEVMSIVGLVGQSGRGHIVAEARYLKEYVGHFAEVAFIVDEAYQSLGISTFLYNLLIRLAKERGIEGFSADVLFSNIGMMKVFRKGSLPVQATLMDGVYQVRIPFHGAESIAQPKIKQTRGETPCISVIR